MKKQSKEVSAPPVPVMSEEDKEALIPVFVKKWIDMQTVQASDEDIVQAVKDMWAECGAKEPEVHIFDSPKACKAKTLPDGFDYWSLWTACSAGTYDYAKTIGVEFDESKLELFTRWSMCCPYIYANDDVVHVSRKPVKISWNDEGQLHCDDGKSVEFADGWGIYTLNNVNVDEQIVMHPETQTIDQLNNEENEEIKRLRIERYGWLKYMKEIGAELLDRSRNDIEGTMEFLYTTTSGMTILLCACPSTAKDFVLECDPSVKTCREAQAWLSSGLSGRIISAS